MNTDSSQCFILLVRILIVSFRVHNMVNMLPLYQDIKTAYVTTMITLTRFIRTHSLLYLILTPQNLIWKNTSILLKLSIPNRCWEIIDRKILIVNNRRKFIMLLGLKRCCWYWWFDSGARKDKECLL